MLPFHLKFQWNLFPSAQFIIRQHWFRYWLGPMQATSHYLAMMAWVIDAYIVACLLLSYCFNTLRPRQNGRHFPHNIFKWVFLNKKLWISIRISLKFVPKDPINNIPALVQIGLDAVQTTSHYLNQWWLVYWRYTRHSASMSKSITIFANCSTRDTFQWYENENTNIIFGKF